jgi:MFS family permease
MLYATIFVWIAVTGGRFLAPFLERECHASASRIGMLLSIQQLIGIPANSWAGATADRLEVRYPGRGRAVTVAVGIVLGTLAFLLHAASRVSDAHFVSDNNLVWLIVLRIWYAVAVSLVFPVMDGMCLHSLGPDAKHDYGKERLWGAITWAVTNVCIAPALDRYGFVVTYPLAIVSAVVVLVTLYTYTTANRRSETYSRLKKRHSDLQTKMAVPDDLSSSVVVVDELVVERNDEHSAVNSSTSPSIPTKELLRRLLFGSSPWYFGAAFLFAVTLLALGQVIVDSLIFLFFEDLGSSYTIMGWTVVLTVLFEIPVFQIADQLLDRVGAAGLLLTAMFCYILRVLGYTLIPVGHVVYALVLEPLHGVTYACSQTAVVDFVAQSMPAGYEATGQGIVYLVRGLGSVVGLLLGGWAEDAVGPRVLYRSAAAVVLTGSLVLGLASLRRQGSMNRRLPVPVTDDVELTKSSSCDGLDDQSSREML